MNCPNCSKSSSRVVDKRNNKENNTVRRRRECLNCGFRYTTYERIESANLLVRKKSGRLEEYDRAKLKNSILKGLKKRSVPEDEVDRFIDNVEVALLAKKSTIIESCDIGIEVLNRLQDLDPVAYMLYATVYLDFNNVQDIETELLKLKSK